tara:strand:+ start:61 stop:504 length:444 start_codon:yes stop_codon:yes gene_type:complete
MSKLNNSPDLGKIQNYVHNDKHKKYPDVNYISDKKSMDHVLSDKNKNIGITRPIISKVEHGSKEIDMNFGKNGLHERFKNKPTNRHYLLQGSEEIEVEEDYYITVPLISKKIDKPFVKSSHFEDYGVYSRKEHSPVSRSNIKLIHKE